MPVAKLKIQVGIPDPQRPWNFWSFKSENPPDFLTWLAGKPTSWRCISHEKWWFSYRNSDFSLKQVIFQ